jgi:hypothetical protein
MCLTGWCASEKQDGCRALWDGQNLWSRGGRIIPIPGSIRAALMCWRPKTTEDRKPQAEQCDLGDMLKLPPAKTEAEWLARLSPNLRAQVQRQRKGPVGFSEIDPVTGCPFAPNQNGGAA